jgi:EAL domain-containing protein (putative c-di-GMP-specific phosphodiesterase class I)
MALPDLSRLLDAAATSAALGAALANGQFFVAYQPRIRLDDRSIEGFEAFVRWQHPERGRVSAADFVSIAQQTGQIVEIGSFVFEQSLARASVWNGLVGAPHVSISVNCDVMQLTRARFVDDLDALIRRHHLDPFQVIVELPSSMLGHMAALRSPIDQVRDLGARVALDDVSLDGMTTLALARLELDMLKIDRSLVHQVVARDQRAIDLVTELTCLAAERSMLVVAEGIENPTELDQLTDLGCDLAQGYFLGEPAPAADADALVRRSANRAAASSALRG